MAGTNPRKKLFLQLILIVILGFCVYANSLGNKFLWDDTFLVKDNIYIKGFSGIPYIFTGTIGMGAGREGPCYRPFQMLTYMCDYRLWQLNVSGYHLTNILLHILVALAIYWLVTILYKKELLSFLTSILFVAHPVHTEAVVYIASRADLLAALFMLLCLIFYIKQTTQRNTAAFILIAISYAAAVLSKEYSLILPALFLLYSYTFKKKLLSREFIFTLAAGIAYILLRSAIVRPALHGPPPQTSILLQRLPGFFVALAEYARILLLPFGLHMEYGGRLFSMNNPKAIAGALILFISLAYAFKKRRSNSPVSFAIFWYFICLLPVADLYPVNAYMAEHWLYLPSAGFFLLFAQGLIYLYKTKKLQPAAVFLTVSLVVVYAYLTARQNTYWKDPVAFYSRTMRYAPASPRLYHNLGMAYMDAGNYQKAIEMFRKALALGPERAGVYNSLGIAFNAMGDRQQALAFYRKATAINPRYADAYFNSGNVCLALGDTAAAIAAYKKAIALSPKNAHAAGYYNNLAAAYIASGNKEEAAAAYEKALAIDPHSAMLRQNLKALRNAAATGQGQAG